jgi:exodeoxyribonuclease V alpha subunit
MREEDPAGRAMYLVAQEVRAGRMPLVSEKGAEGGIAPRATPSALAFEAVELLPTNAQREAFLDRWFQDRVVGDAGFDFEGLIRREYVCRESGFSEQETKRLQKLFDRLQGSRILCLTRSETRPNGAGSINADLHARLAVLLKADESDTRFSFLPGEPVLMTQNDYDLGLFNGDQGVLLRVRYEGEARHQLRFVFPVKGRFRALERGALRQQVMHSWAMTVHKAQGSEFDHVALMLPSAEEREHAGETRSLLVREIVYTAMTRARKSVTLVGEPEALEEAVSRSIKRHSELSTPAFWKE